jgi:hypothetical protein
MRKPRDFDEPLCIEVGTALFFPEGSSSSVNGANLQAKKVCRLCKHINECAEWAIFHEAYGVWGATTPLEREQIRKDRKIQRVVLAGESR